MRAIIFCFLAHVVSPTANAQFYPEANAVWCGQDDDGGPPGFHVQFQMGATPDTLINGAVYKKIQEFNDESGNWTYKRSHYVRSDSNGMGYVYLPDSTDEYVTGDLLADAGDTVHDVLSSITNSTDINYYLSDVLVDSVVSLSNAGVAVVRRYVRGEFLGGPATTFWQARMGTSYGPLLEGSGIFYLSGVGDTIMYDLGNYGLPGPIGVDQICWPINMGLQEVAPLSNAHLQITPNPVVDDLLIAVVGNGAGRVGRLTILDPTGRVVLTTNMQGPLKELDVSQLNGFFTVVVDADGMRMTGRVIIQ
jgi:hypothetical protein